MKEFALTIKQPWATLLVHGLKKIEIRSWSTRRQGRVLVHAALVSDNRPQGWARLPARLKQAAEQRGGIIGAANLVDCLAYRQADQFRADELQHLNDPSWFDGSTLYGFLFEQPEVLPFHKCPGWFRFFSVEFEVSDPNPTLPPGS